MRFSFQSFIINILASLLLLILTVFSFILLDRMVLDGRFTGAYNKDKRIHDLVARLNEERLVLFEEKKQTHTAQTQASQLKKELSNLKIQQQTTLANIPSYQLLLKLKKNLIKQPGTLTKAGRLGFEKNVFFEERSTVLSEKAKQDLNQIARALKALEQSSLTLPWRLQVGGATSQQNFPSASGYPSYWQLGYERALAVVQYLVSLGVPPHRLYIASFSHYMPDNSPQNKVSFFFESYS